MAPVRKIARAEVFDLRSSLLGKHVRYSVIFPADYSSASADLPLLYLLHGLFGSHENWLTKTNILEYAADHSFLIVCPDDGDGWYTDSPHLKGHCYESYLLQELMPAVEGRFRAGGLRSRRAVAGISMGGYGAFKLAFRQPEMFCLAASMSGAFHAAEVTADGAWPELQPSILEIFRDNDPLRKENNIFEIAEAFDPTQAARPPVPSLRLRDRRQFSERKQTLR